MKYETFLPSPLGLLQVVHTGTVIEQIDFLDQVDEPPAVSGATGLRIIAQLQDELAAYFDGTLRIFSVPFVFKGGTVFQRKVWQALLRIPYGRTLPYGDVAKALGLSAGASRAVGNACGANPLPLIVPCHRIVAARGGLGGYSGGLWRKRRLLEREGAYPL